MTKCTDKKVNFTQICKKMGTSLKMENVHLKVTKFMLKVGQKLQTKLQGNYPKAKGKK